MSERKKVDRLYVDKKDIADFNRLKDKDSPFAGSQNKDVFLAAMIIGYHEGSRLELKRKEGYVREEYLTDEDLALIRAIAISEDGNINVLLDKQKTFSIAEEYATGGIKLLKARAFSGEYGSYAKKLESELLRICDKIVRTSPKEPQTFDELAGLSVVDLIKSGETDILEFKSSMIWDYEKEQKNKLMAMIVAKVISSFMNSNGGILVVGVDNDKNIIGLDKDLAQLESGSLDEFELYFTNAINKYLGKINRPYVSIKFESLNGEKVAIVYARKSPRPVYVKYKDSTEFYIRSGNSSQPLDIKDATQYITDHWPDLR